MPCQSEGINNMHKAKCKLHQTTTFCCQFLHTIRWFGSPFLVSDLVPANVIVQNKNSGTVNAILLKYLQKPPHIILQGDCGRCLFPFGCVSGWWVLKFVSFPSKWRLLPGIWGSSILRHSQFASMVFACRWPLEYPVLAWFASYSSALRACKGENGSRVLGTL